MTSHTKEHKTAVELVYHKGNRGESPLDACVVSIAREADLRIACPYISLDYLQRLLRISRSWRLITDANEWLASCDSADRPQVCKFIREHFEHIRHSGHLHAKVRIGTNTALIGSANLTMSGIRIRTEMCVWIKGGNLHSELCDWYDRLWPTSVAVPNEQLETMSKRLPQPRFRNAPELNPHQEQRHTALVDLAEDHQILRFEGAWGCAKGYQTSMMGFMVLKDSTAKRDVSPSFLARPNYDYARRRRKELIEEGALIDTNHPNILRFSRNVGFNSPSLAATIVAGTPKDGKAWR